MIAKKVLFIHDGPLYTNSERTIFYGIHYNNELIERYSFFGKQVTFLTRRTTLPMGAENNFSVLEHPAFAFIEVPNFKSMTSYFNKQEATSIIKKAVDTHDIMVLRLPSAIGVIAFEYARSINKPILIEVVSCVYDALWNYDWRGKLLARYKMKLYQNILLKATHAIYVTNEFLQSRYPTTGKSIGCSDVILQDSDTSIYEQRLHKIRTASKLLTIGTVAALDVKYKGQADVIKVIAKLKKKQVNIRYKLVGQGNPTRLLKLITQLGVGDLVEIIGPLSQNDVFTFIDTLDLYIQPSKQEGLPRAVVEAMSRACPVLGSHIAGIPELISKDALFEAGNLNAIERLLLQINTVLLEKLAQENFTKASEFKKELLNMRRTQFYADFLIASKQKTNA